jgi:hypothetical protein
MNYLSTKIKFVILMLFAFSVLLFLDLGVPQSIFFWISCGMLGYLPTNRFARSDQSYVKKIYILSYLLLSLIGLIITFDNYKNSGVYFGFAGDDTRYFEKAAQLLSGTVPEEAGAYPIILCIYGQFVKLFTGQSYVLTDLLPLNWVFGAWTVVISGLLANFFSKNKCPFFILLITVILNFKFMDSVTRLYRETFVLFFFLLSIYLLIIKNKGYFVFTFFTGLLRVANALLLLLLAAILVIKKRVTSHRRFYTIMGVGCLLMYLVLLQGSFNFLAYMSNASRIGRYHDVFSDYSYQQAIEQRHKGVLGEIKEDSLTGYAFGKGSAVGEFLKVPISYFFPFTFNSPSDVKRVYSSQANVKYANGFYFFEIVKWFTVLAWPVVLPMVAFGVLGSIKKSDWHAVMLLYYMILIFAIPVISGQIRHCCAYVLLTPVFANLGYWEILKDRRAWRNAITLGVFVMIAIGLWNYIKIFR